MTYWKATVRRPDGAGGWDVVGVFGTDDSPVAGTGKYLHGDTALEAAQLLLSHVWPIDLATFNKYDGADRWKMERQAKTGIADLCITVEVGDRKWDVPYGQPTPEPLTITVAELRLIDIRRMVAESVAASAKAAELARQARIARNDAWYAKRCIEGAVEEATRAGVDEAAVTKAKRVPRAPRKKATQQTKST